LGSNKSHVHFQTRHPEVLIFFGSGSGSSQRGNWCATVDLLLSIGGSAQCRLVKEIFRIVFSLFEESASALMILFFCDVILVIVLIFRWG
jgi:hypothetical protein